MFLICLMIRDWYFLLSTSEKFPINFIFWQSSISDSHLLSLESPMVVELVHAVCVFEREGFACCPVRICTGRSRGVVAEPFSVLSKYACLSL